MDFSKLREYVDTLSGQGVPGCDIAVFKDGSQVFRHMAGHRDAEGRVPMQGDETYCLFSCTKMFTSCAAMQLIERGLMGLDDPVSDYLPAYARLTVQDGARVRPARRVMTIRHLMSMQSGLDYNLESPAIIGILEKTGGKATTREVVDAKAADPLMFEPGTDFLYSLSHDVLAAVIEVVSGLRFSEYLQRNIFDPLGLNTIGFTPKDSSRQCAQFMRQEDGSLLHVPDTGNNYRFSPNYESGGAGLISDLHDCAAFVNALSCEGGGLLKPDTLRLWSANQLCPRGRDTFNTWKRLGYSYALGVRTRVDLTVGGHGQIGEFGWDGAAGGWGMIDPYNRIAAYYAMHVRNFGYEYDVIHPNLRDLIYKGFGL